MPTFPENIASFLSRLRLGLPNQNESIAGVPGEGMPGPYVMNMQDQPFTPKTEAQDRLRVALDQMPTRNTPGFWRKMGAGLVGMGSGPQVAEHFKYAPYYHGLEDWKNKVEPLGDLARIENQENTQNRLAQSEINRTRRADQTDERLNRKLDEDVKIKNARLDIDRAKLEVMRETGSKIRVDRDGKEYLVRRDGSVLELPYQALTFQDKLELQQAGKLEIIGAQLESAKALETERATNRETLADIQARHAKELAEARADQQIRVNEAKSSDPKQMTPNEIKQEKINRVSEYVRAHPELEGRITEDDLGNIRMTPKRVYPWQSPDPNDAKVIQEFNDWVDKGIRPKRMGAVPAPTTETKSTTNVSPERAAQVAPDNMIRVRNKKTGATGRMKRSELGKYKDFEEIK